MRKVLVIGPGGAGKSTFATKLGKKTGLPVLHLDAHYWRRGWVETPKHEWQEVVRGLTSGDAWIMDGNYRSTLDLRLAACDMIVFLDMPRLVCLWRVIQRWWRFRRTARPDMTPGCPERLDFEFLHWIWTYPSSHRPRLLEPLSKLRQKRVVVLRSTLEAERS